MALAEEIVERGGVDILCDQEKVGVELETVVDADDIRMIDSAQKADFVDKTGDDFRRAIVAWDPAQKCGFFKDPVHGDKESVAVGSDPLNHPITSYDKFRFEHIHRLTPVTLLEISSY